VYFQLESWALGWQLFAVKRSLLRNVTKPLGHAIVFIEIKETDSIPSSH
jgi:hypothetical protein